MQLGLGMPAEQLEQAAVGGARRALEQGQGQAQVVMRLTETRQQAE